MEKCLSATAFLETMSSTFVLIKLTRNVELFIHNTKQRLKLATKFVSLLPSMMRFRQCGPTSVPYSFILP
jgi:hypothetical protein